MFSISLPNRAKAPLKQVSDGREIPSYKKNPPRSLDSKFNEMRNKKTAPFTALFEAINQ